MKLLSGEEKQRLMSTQYSDSIPHRGFEIRLYIDQETSKNYLHVKGAGGKAWEVGIDNMYELENDESERWEQCAIEVINQEFSTL